MEHFSHEHPLLLSKYNNSSEDALCCGCNDPFSPPYALCKGCRDPILKNTDVYHCNVRLNRCADFYLHKTCAELPMRIQHHLHPKHVLTLHLFTSYFGESVFCKCCSHETYCFYRCSICGYDLCSKCTSVECEIKHPSHNHTLTLLPSRAILHTCTACGTRGREDQDFSYLCQPCGFWIHKTCASAPPTLTRHDHDDDHPLVLAYSLPMQYWIYGVPCSLCPDKVDWFSWLYYCAICRYFAHLRCALSAPESAKDEEDDVDGSDVVHFPMSENEPYQLIQQFANKFTISSEEKSGKANVISECRNGHSLVLFDDFNNKSVVETNTSEKRICDGCVQPLLSTPDDPFYGCLDCNFFLHDVCAAELPREIQHPKKELSRLTRCHQISKPWEFNRCKFCYRSFNGVGYSDDSGEYSVDIVCAALPSKIKHDSHRHTLHQLSDTNSKQCRGCDYYIIGLFFGCQACDYNIDIKCALLRGTIKHRWDEHELILMYPPVKGHPHDFNCELCSQDINPNYWFYHCCKCDTSFHTYCINPDEYTNFKYGGIVRDDNLHQHNLKFTRVGAGERSFKCGCDLYRRKIYYWSYKYKCESCKFSVCYNCFGN